MALTKKEVIEYIKKLPTPELNELIQELQEELGITPETPQLQPFTVTAGMAPYESFENFEYSVILTEVGPNRIEVIKTIRALTGKGLAACKEIVEALPHTLAEGIPKEAASQWVKQLNSSGALAELKQQ